jgi:lysophospholipase L1-like esterase
MRPPLGETIVRRFRVGFLAVAILGAVCATPLRGAQWVEWRDGERVVFIGSTLIERDQTYGYLETLLTSIVPNRRFTIRNLGWSGDNVLGAARARFGPVSEGYEHLKTHIEALKPTLVLVGYGTNESFEGRAGLQSFVDGLNTLLDMIQRTGARVIVLTPPRQEDLGRPLPDPAKHNADLKLYVDAMIAIARKREYEYVDLFELLPTLGSAPSAKAPLTDDGLHLTAYGYWKAAQVIVKNLFGRLPVWSMEIDASSGSVTGPSAITHVQRLTDGIRFVCADRSLPLPAAPQDAPTGAAAREASRTLTLKGLKRGRYDLKIDGAVIEKFEASQERMELQLLRGPMFDQAEQLRQAINAKNLLYFHRWRPQNETYLFGFRKHEQGQNAREVPLFDPLVAKREEEIAVLREPLAHTFELIREGEVGK